MKTFINRSLSLICSNQLISASQQINGSICMYIVTTAFFFKGGYYRGLEPMCRCCNYLTDQSESRTGQQQICCKGILILFYDSLKHVYSALQTHFANECLESCACLLLYLLYCTTPIHFVVCLQVFVQVMPTF